MLPCKVFGHRYRFRADAATMVWTCQRCGNVGGQKAYAWVAEAQRYAEVLDREDRDDMGRRAPLVGLLPLRIWRAWRDSRS